MSFQWNQSLSVGIEKIDDQHKQIFSRVNRLMEATAQGKGKEEIGQVMDFLGNYVGGHFAMEESAMVEHRYPASVAHRQLHQGFLKEYSDLSAQFRRDGASSQLVIAIQRRVCDWLLNHIGKSDRDLGAYLLDKTPVTAR